jgi:hypothetical protein
VVKHIASTNQLHDSERGSITSKLHLWLCEPGCVEIEVTGARGLCLKSCSTILFTPGFSQVKEVNAEFGNRLNGFRPNFDFRSTWLKPGVTETKRVERRKLGPKQSRAKDIYN